MSFNGSGLFVINSAGQPVVFNTIIDETVFNALTADLATGLSTCITKDGQTTPTANLPMGGFRLTGLGAGAANGESVRYEQWRSMLPLVQELRMSASATDPVTTTDQTAITSLRVAPYKGNRIALYDGSAGWNIRTISSNFGVVIPSTTNTPFDLFLYDNGGTVTAETLSWTNDTTRATALVYQDGVLVKSGATTRRYIGTCRTTGVSGQIEDSLAKRFIWNYYNRALRPMRVLEATNSWTYTTATIRQANGAAANQLDFVVGVAEDAVVSRICASATSDTTVSFQVGVGYDTTSAFTAGGLIANTITQVAGGSYPSAVIASLTLIPAIGRHFLSWNEYSTAVGTTTWYGDGLTNLQSGITGEIWA